MRVLIFGCGYLGLRAAQVWLSREAEVVALTRSMARAERLRASGILPVIGDVMQPETLRNLPAADICLYSVGFDRGGGHDKRVVYVEGLRTALAAIAPRTGRLIHISSTSVYGQNSGELVDEDSPTHPSEDSGRICHEAEDVVRECAALGFPGGAVILRLSGIYGPGRLIGRLDQLRAQLPLTGNPQAWLNLIHVEDAACAAVQLGDRPDLSGTWLLSDERPLRREEFYTQLSQLAGVPGPVFAPAGEPGLNKRCDSARLRAALGLKLEYPTVDQGLLQALAATTG